MLRELLHEVVGLADRARALQSTRITGIDDKVLVQSGDYDAQWVDLPSPRVETKLVSFDSFVAAIGTTPGAVVHYDENGLHGFLSSVARRDHVTLALQRTSQALTILELEKRSRTFKSPKEAVRFLRFELPSAIPEGVRRAFSAMKFSQTGIDEVTVAHGREMLGRSVQAQLGADDSPGIPEEFTAEIRLWSNPGFFETISVTIGVYIDTTEKTVEIKALADEGGRSLLDAVESVGERLRAAVLEGIPVYHGRP